MTSMLQNTYMFANPVPALLSRHSWSGEGAMSTGQDSPFVRNIAFLPAAMLDEHIVEDEENWSIPVLWRDR